MIQNSRACGHRSAIASAARTFLDVSIVVNNAGIERGVTSLAPDAVDAAGQAITYDGPDGLQWQCRRCGAEGFEERDPTP